MPEYFIAASAEDFQNARKLFEEYLQWLNLDLTFQKVNTELLHLQDMYSLPDGGIVLCKVSHEFVGCVGIRKLNGQTAEMKRLYVKPTAQRKGIATNLLLEAEKLALQCGYTSIRLDTLQTMTPAMNLYLSNGYVITEAYYHNPIETAVYFYKELSPV